MTFGSLFSPSTVWFLRFKLQVTSLGAKPLYPLSLLTGPRFESVTYKLYYIHNVCSAVCVSLLSPLSDSVLEHLSCLAREVNLDYERSMNKINFDQIVSSNPETFSYVTLPEKEEEKVPNQGESHWTLAAHLASSPHLRLS